MLVLKFGGTSVGSPEAIEKLIAVLKDREHREYTRVVVVSAFSGVTDSLIAAAKEAAGGKTPAQEGSAGEGIEALGKRHFEAAAHFLEGEALEKTLEELKGSVSELARVLAGVAALRELSKRTLDYIMSFGERLSAFLLAQVLGSQGFNAEYLDTRPLIKTDEQFGGARFKREETYRLIQDHFAVLKPGPGGFPPLQVATGFIGSTGEGITTTLGRGGSDLTAAIFGAALDAGEVEIWTDVDGILTADPRLVKEPFLIESISYEEAMELSLFGAKIIYPPTIRPSLEKGIPIRVRNTFRPSCMGTKIVKDAEPGKYPIRGISSFSHIALIRFQGSGMVGTAGFSSRLFGALARRGINIILISQGSSEYSICFAVLPQDVPLAEEAVRAEFDREISQGSIEEPVSEDKLCIIAVVGSRMKSSSGIAGKVFHALGRNGINVVAIAQGSSELNISAVISRQDEAKAMNAIHEAFFLSGVRSVNLFLVGIGLIGGTLVNQIAGHREILADRDKIRINLVGAANSRK
ncbi:MAG: aspartate kinase, partial [Treponema sp.]|nr:aspartate kinase [Treponema sp.]